MKEEASMKAKQLYLSFFPLSATTQRTMDTHTNVPVLWTLQSGSCGGIRPSSGLQWVLTVLNSLLFPEAQAVPPIAHHRTLEFFICPSS